MAEVVQEQGEARHEIVEAVLTEVRAVMPKELVDQLTPDSSLFELGLDSVAIMDVVNRIEKQFGMRFREEWLYDMETCADLVDCIMRHRNPETAAEPTPAPAAAKEATAPPAESGPIPAAHYDVAQFPECVAFHQRLAAAKAVGLENPFFRVHDRIGHGCATIDGREMINYTSFDYLGLAGHPEVVAAAKAAIDRLGCSATASRLVGGNHRLLEELDQELARFLGTEAAIAFPSGYGTNASVLGHLFGENDLILYDELAHNSMFMGATASKAGRRSFPHNDADALDELLRDIRGRYRRVGVAIESVYSMDGDYPDLPRFIEVKRRHRAVLYVDEAHAVGTMGRTGRGLCEHFGVEPAEGDVWMGTISKGLGSGGGYLAGREPLMRYLKYTTPSFVFATACSPANAAAALTALRVLQKEPERVVRLRERSAQFLKLARECGLNTGHSHDTPIVPIILGNSAQCLRVSQELLRQSINAQPILYPAVRESAARVRFFISAEHTEEQIARTVKALAECIAATSDMPASAG
ncbi:MAG: aminotransferase class I/II-fold pyridoxal phosphate-dependent enzyme [Candidatus Anammoximicrobium sp.]|nr:aminotransferase class I/II-fold pyridoxal phosphate-dependent enzyme [Candidatus Anammoximicrobium sp.]